MSKTITAKFNVSSITKYGNGGGTKVTLSAATTGEGNETWSKYTPSGTIEMHITNPDAEFEFGYYFLTFEKAED
jgi:hypothetical protein